MRAVTVEFFGGPWDGDLRAIEDPPPPRLEFAMLTPSGLPAASDPEAVVEPRRAYYRLRRDGNYQWEGEA